VQIPNLTLKIEYVALTALRENPRNARRHSAKQIEHLKAIISQAGFVQPGLVDQHNTLIAGHGRLEAARQLGLQEMPVVRLSHLKENELRALALADNRIAELATWDEEVLKVELSELVLEDLDFSISDVTGFAGPEIDAITFGPTFGSDPADGETAAPANPVTHIGDCWKADGVTLVCGDALRPATYAALDGERANMALTDMPYNVAITGHVSGKGRAKHREFLQGSGEMSEREFTAFLSTACERLKEHVANSALIYLFMDGAHLFELLHAARAANLRQKAFLTWAKTNAGMGSLYRSQTEHIAVFKKSGEPHVNNVQLGRFGRNRTTLWSYPGVNSFGRDRDAALAHHPTVKPVAMLADAILDASNRQDLILDPFSGSGSTLIAAHRTQRRAFGVELDPLYVDVALARIEQVTELAFAREADGAKFADLANAKSRHE
jgi:DNA modification methylase